MVREIKIPPWIDKYKSGYLSEPPEGYVSRAEFAEMTNQSITRAGEILRDEKAFDSVRVKRGRAVITYYRGKP